MGCLVHLAQREREGMMDCLDPVGRLETRDQSAPVACLAILAEMEMMDCLERLELLVAQGLLVHLEKGDCKVLVGFKATLGLQGRRVWKAFPGGEAHRGQRASVVAQAFQEKPASTDQRALKGQEACLGRQEGQDKRALQDQRGCQGLRETRGLLERLDRGVFLAHLETLVLQERMALLGFQGRLVIQERQEAQADLANQALEERREAAVSEGL